MQIQDKQNKKVLTCTMPWFIGRIAAIVTAITKSINRYTSLVIALVLRDATSRVIPE